MSEHLRVENQVNPLGVEHPQPRFSWHVPQGGQRGYRITVTTADAAPLWDSGAVQSSQCNGVAYDGPPLQPRRRYLWRVQIVDTLGQAHDSDEAWFETGIGEWQADWIGGTQLTDTEPRLEGCARIGPAGVFRHEFHIPAGARVIGERIRSSGVVYLNGQRDGHVQFGRNVLAVQADQPFVLRLHVVFADRAPQVVETDDTWQRSTDQHGDWQSVDYDDSAWTRAERVGRYGDPPWGRDPGTERPAPLLRTEFQLSKPIRQARLCASALGVYDLRLNGQRVGDDVLAPGWTDYPSRVPYQIYDVTAMLQQGSNALGALLGDGWYAGYLGFFGPARYGAEPLFIAQLEVAHDDDTRTVITTDQTWRTATGEITYSDAQMGETIDARRRQSGWDRTGFDADAWRPVTVGHPQTRLEAERAPRMAAQIDLQPISVSEPTPGAIIFDMGQNMVGWVRLTARGERGQKIVVRFAEVVNPDGTLYTANLRSAQCTDEFILAGDPGGETFEPCFTHHGFRYVEVTGYPGTPGPGAIVGRVVFARMALSGSFECSNADLNQLQSNIQWGQRGNFLSVPTDCPQRDERLGWTGDAQVFCATAAFNMDVQNFMAKWLYDVMDVQLPSGAVTHFAPIPADVPRHGSGGAAGWADAIVVVPWTLYWLYGDRRILEETYAACGAWIAYVERTSDGLIRPAEGFGDWLSIDAETPKDLIGTAYFAYSAGLMARIARVLDRSGDAAVFTDLARRVRLAFRARFVKGGGRVEGETQTAYVLALQTGMFELDEVERAAQNLLRDIAFRNWHLSTGFLGTPWLLPVLSENGHLDEAYRLLMQDSQPSWLFPVRNGATTMWERWDSWSLAKGFHSPFTTEGHRTVNMNSFNHYAYGCVGDWLYRVVGGIECLAPGYERVRIAPRPGAGLTWATTRYESVRGPIACAWKIEDGRLRVTVEIPPTVTAEVELPGQRPIEVGPGTHEYSA